MLLFRGGNDDAAIVGPVGPAICGIGDVCVRGGVWICNAGGPVTLLCIAACCLSSAIRSLGLRLGDDPEDPEAGVDVPLAETARSPAVSLPGLCCCDCS